VRVDRPQAEYFRYAAPGTLVARPKAHQEQGAVRRAVADLRRVLFGRPLATEEEIGERLSKRKALAIFSSDAISSSAYATEEILRALLVGGVAALAFSLPVAAAIAVLLGVVAISYRQVCIAYPTGGGSYSVSKANFGPRTALLAASALLIDYVLTVAVSISSASEQIAAAIPAVAPWHVVIAVAFIVLITMGNLRGLRESGNIFAVPTYLFVVTALLMIALGTFQVLVLGQGVPSPAAAEAAEDLAGAALVILLLRAFASGAVALTGTEAIATGVPAFRPPEPRNAATTLTAMAILLGVLFVGITFLATAFHVIPNDEQTVIAQVAGHVFGEGSIGFYLFLAFAALILVLAANTSFNAFPRLAAVLAEDGYFPRQFAFRGDRLAFTLGIVTLGLFAAALVIAFNGDTHALIPLYAVGVFIDFTISQSGLIRHWLATRAQGWQYRLAINAAGASVTAVVAVVVTIAKAPASLVVLVLLPTFALMMSFVRREYDTVARELALRPGQRFGPPAKHNRVIVPVPGLSRAVVQSIQFGRSLSEDVRAVHITADMEEAARLREDWEASLPGVPLVIVETPYRSLVTPFIHYLEIMAPPEPGTVTIVVLPEYVPRHWWDRLLYNQTAHRLRRALVGRPDTVVAGIPYARERDLDLVRPGAGATPGRS
jgi:amino acid transporter